MYIPLTAAVWLVAGSLTVCQDTAVTTTLERYAAARPSAKELAFYSLDWVCSLPEARARARAENRLILLVLNTNITAHCNFYSGHT